jgi:hypothetical protein
MLFDYDTLRATPVSSDPFPHVVVRNFVPPETLKKVVADLPTLNRRGSFPPSSFKAGPMARAAMDELEDDTLKDIVAEKFGLDLADAPTMLTLRGRTEATDGRIHRDSVSKRVTVLLYLNPASADWAGHAGCLRLLRRPDDLEDYAVEVPPVDGTLLVFPNGPTTWHGHHSFTGRRYTIQLNYMTTDGKARTEMMRHQLSAFVKRVTGAFAPA